jgi:hypothetical protein
VGLALFPPQPLLEPSLFLLLFPLQLGDSQVVIIDRNTEHFLSPFLSNNELIEVLL